MVPEAVHGEPRIASFGWCERRAREAGVELHGPVTHEILGAGWSGRWSNAHPTLSEAVLEAALAAAGRALHA